MSDAIEVLKELKGKILVLGSDHCPACKSLMERVNKDQIMKDKIVFKSVERDELAQAIAEEFDIRSVPSFFTVTFKRKKAYICKLDDNMNLIEECREIEIQK